MLADHALIVKSDSTARIQEAHILICHIICDLIEKGLDLDQSSASLLATHPHNLFDSDGVFVTIRYGLISMVMNLYVVIVVMGLH